MSERKPLDAEYVGKINAAAMKALGDVKARRKWGDSQEGSPITTNILCAEIARLNLWCCAVRGPDDVHPAPDYETALAWCDLINDQCGPHIPKDDNFPIIRAAPAIWPWSAKAHADGIEKAIAEFAQRPRKVD